MSELRTIICDVCAREAKREDGIQAWIGVSVAKTARDLFLRVDAHFCSVECFKRAPELIMEKGLLKP